MLQSSNSSPSSNDFTAVLCHKNVPRPWDTRLHTLEHKKADPRVTLVRSHHGAALNRCCCCNYHTSTAAGWLVCLSVRYKLWEVIRASSAQGKSLHFVSEKCRVERKRHAGSVTKERGTVAAHWHVFLHLPQPRSLTV